MLASSSLQSLLSQFQARYPIGCLSAELLTIHQEQYVIRAVIQLGSQTLATAMAENANLEAAEDRAKLRVLEAVLGPNLASAPAAASSGLNLGQPIQTEPVLTPVQPLPGQPLSQPLHTSQPDAPALLQTASTSISPAFGSIDAATQVSPVAHPASAYAEHLSPGPSWEAEFQSVTQLNPPAESSIEPEPVKGSVSSLRTSKAERASKRSTEPVLEQPVPQLPEQPVGQTAVEPADRSEEIMRIGIEMKRLGWSTEQGREYLKRTYGKSSRSKLDDAELLDFLHYLEMQSSPLQTQTPF
jgi:hypothetical protein